MLKGILFDMDGILINSEIYYINESYFLLKNLGFTGEKKDIHRVIGTTMDVTYQIFAELLEHRYTKEEVCQFNEQHYEVHPLVYPDYVFEDVVKCIREFKKMGLKMAVCSSSPLVAIEECVHSLNIEDCFDEIISGEDFVLSKPNPEIYLHALKKLGLKADEAIVYEDSCHGIMAGVSAKVFTIAKIDRLFGIDQSQADAHVESMSELKELVLKRMEG
ncbi:MAG: HAD family phosphatase [Erysipelotrichaceae bacterium]